MAMGRLEFRILGPLTVLADGEPVSVGGPKQRALLALLLLSANRVVSRDRLIAELFADLSPNSADHALRNQVSRLRKVLGATGADPPRLVARPPGYLLRVGPSELDLEQFERLVAEGREALSVGDAAAAAGALAAAEALWSGRALADLELDPFVRVEVDRLEELRLAAVEERVDADLALGRHLALVGELEALSAEHPYRERFRAQLMLALYRSGRQAEGLGVYRETRKLLNDELGLEPCVELQELERAILVQEPELRPPGGTDADRMLARPESLLCPFKGLAPFEPDDHELFFGRERLVEELVARLDSTTFLLLTGPSGSGKSSLLRAGLLPALDGRRMVVRPGLRPSTELKRVLGADLPEALDGLGPRERLVLAVDQLEEAFAAEVDATECDAFLAALVDAAWDAERRAVIVLALRGDFFGRLGSHAELADLAGSNHALLGPMSPAELRRAITRPAEHAGLSVEPALVDALVQEVAGEPGGLPLLSAALLDLWRDRTGPSLTLAAYERTGGVRGAVSRYAEATLHTLPEDEQPVARRIVLRLVAGGDGEAITRRRATLVELDADDPQVSRVLAALVEMRLLVANDDSVELVHEALLEQWPRLTEWLEEDAEGRRVQRHVAAAATAWESAGRDPSDLYRGARLAAALDWADTAGATAMLNSLERDFLEQSRSALTRESERRQRSNRRLRSLLVAAVILLAAAAVAGATVFVERADARQQATSAVAQRLGAQALVEPSLDTALLLAREGVNLDDSSATAGNLLATLLRSPAAIGIARSSGTRVLDDALSPDGRLLVFLDDEGSVVFLNASTLRRVDRPFSAGNQLSMFGSIKRPVGALAFSPDGRTLAVGSTTGTIAELFLLDARTHRPRSLAESSYVATADVVFSPSGRRLATGEIVSGRISPPAEVIVLRNSRNGDELAHSRPLPAARLIGFVAGGRELLVTTGEWRSVLLDAKTLRRVRILRNGGAAAVSRSGTLAAFGHADGSIALVDLRTGSARTMNGSAGAAVERLAFSADGRLLASTAANGSVAVWSVPAASLRETFLGHSAAADGPVFSPYGRTLYAGSTDGTVIAWDIRGSRRLGKPFSFAPVAAAGQGAEPEVAKTSTASAVSPDGSLFATTPGRGRVTIWRTRDEAVVDELRGPAVPHVNSLAFSHDGRLLAAGERQGLVIWNVARRTVVSVIRVPSAQFAVAFSPDDRLVAGAGEDGTLRVYRLRTGRLLGLAQAPYQASLQDLDFSADGRLVAAASLAGDVVIWNVVRRKTVQTIYHGPAIYTLRFAPNGTTIATGDNSGNVDFWDALSGRQLPETLGGDGGPVSSVSFDSTGNRLVTTSDDGNIRLWDLTDDKLIGAPLPGGNGFGRGTFYPDGDHVLAVFPSGTGIVWNVDPASWSAQACRVARRNLTRAEWRDFLPQRPFRPVCGSEG
jgi:WD40 repeat protein/DNA-binding SARP family transcriptional activator/energy-coupling factor transporter ATP-binding protein EcfA2